MHNAGVLEKLVHVVNRGKTPTTLRTGPVVHGALVGRDARTRWPLAMVPVVAAGVCNEKRHGQAARAAAIPCSVDGQDQGLSGCSCPCGA